MKTQAIVFLQSHWDPKIYIVDRLVNRVTPTVGAVFTANIVNQYCQDRGVKVTINRTKGGFK